MSAFLLKDAEAAEKKRDWGHAIPLYEAIVVARGPGSAEARKLATIYTLATDRDNARRVLEAFTAATDDPAARSDAEAEIERLKNAPGDAYARPVALASLDKQAKDTFKLGLDAFKKKAYGDALVYYTMGYQLAPDLPGFLRELGSTYDKLGASDRKIEFYRAYLRRRPLGKNADEVRKSLAKEKNVLGSLTISSVLPCDQVFLVGQPVPGKLPKKDLLVAPGTYKAMCFSQKYEFASFERATVTAGQPAELTFNWAIIDNELDKPLGRIAIEDASTPGVLRDLGVDQPEIGVLVPSDGRALRMVLKDDTGTRTEERFVKLAPGQRLVVKW